MKKVLTGIALAAVGSIQLSAQGQQYLQLTSPTGDIYILRAPTTGVSPIILDLPTTTGTLVSTPEGVPLDTNAPVRTNNLGELITGPLLLGSEVSGLLLPVNGGTGVDGSVATDGQLLIGSTGNGFTLGTITGTGAITVTNGPGTIEISYSGPLGSGTTNYLPLWTNDSTLANSIINQNVGATQATVNGTLNVRNDMFIQSNMADNTTTVRVRSGSSQGTDDVFLVEQASGNNIFRTRVQSGYARAIVGGTATPGELRLYNGTGESTNGVGILRFDVASTVDRIFTLPVVNANGTVTIAQGQGTLGQVLTSGGAGQLATWQTSYSPSAGTTLNSTLRWNNSAWVENVNFLADSIGNIGANGFANIGGALIVGGGAAISGNATFLGDTINMANIPAGTSNDFVVRNAGGYLEYRTINNGVTGSGVANTIPIWSDSSTLTNSIITQDAGGTMIEVGGLAQINGDADITGTLYVSLLDGPLRGNLGEITTGPLNLATEVTGILPLANGGTGLDSATAANGTLLIGNGTGFTLDTLTPGAGIMITNGSGSITIGYDGLMLPAGGTIGSTLRWDGSNWVNNDSLIADGLGSLSATGSIAAGGALTAGTTLTVGGAALLNGGATVTGDASVTGTLTVDSTTTLNGTTISLPNIGTSTSNDFVVRNGNDLATRTIADIVTGTGVANTIPIWSDSSTLTNSIITQDAGGTMIEVGGLAQINGDADITGTLYVSLLDGPLRGNLGEITTGPLNLATEVTGILPLANGGTGLDSATAANGTLLIGNGTGFTLDTLTPGAGIMITNGAGSITIAYDGLTLPTGTVDNSTLRWDTTADNWVENTALLVTTTGEITSSALSGTNSPTVVSGTEEGIVVADANGTLSKRNPLAALGMTVGTYTNSSQNPMGTVLVEDLVMSPNAKIFITGVNLAGTGFSAGNYISAQDGTTFTVTFGGELQPGESFNYMIVEPTLVP